MQTHSDPLCSLASDPIQATILHFQQGTVSQIFQLKFLKDSSAYPTPPLEKKERKEGLSAQEPPALTPWIGGGRVLRGRWSGSAAALSDGGKSEHCDWNPPDCLWEVRSGGFLLFYYIRVVYLVARGSEDLSRGTAEKPSD